LPRSERDNHVNEGTDFSSLKELQKERNSIWIVKMTRPEGKIQSSKTKEEVQKKKSKVGISKERFQCTLWGGGGR